MPSKKVYEFSGLVAFALFGLVMGLVLAMPTHARTNSGFNSHYPYLAKARYFRGTCSSTIKPDYAAIEGGIDAADPDLAKAAKTVKQKLRNIRSVARRYGAKIIEKELIRAMRSAPRVRRLPVMPVPAQPIPNQFHVIQRLEINAPLSVNVDQLVSRLSKNGMSQMGKRVNLYRSRNSQVIVFYRFRKLDTKLEKLRNECITNAIQNWCARQFSPAESQNCIAAITTLIPQLQVQYFNVKVGPHARGNGYSGYSSLRYPWQKDQMDKIELIGNTRVPVSGSINLKVPRQQYYR
jgi:hypothetical protein